jgi:uncharacterized cupredoxin-like copper-binding protein
MKRVALLSVLLGAALALAACGPKGAKPNEQGELLIIQEDLEGMKFVPETVVLTAGQRVRIILENRGEKAHEFMVGRNVIRTADGAANGFEVDFFEGVEVKSQLGEGAMLMIDGETVMMGGMDDQGMGEGEMAMGEEGEHGEDEHGMGHMGFMVMSEPASGRTVLEFTVPASAVGEWEMGCFEDDGAHYDDGMRGTLIVVSP